MIKLSVILNITRTHLLSRIKQTTIAGLGVMFGIGTFIILVSFMTGLNQLLDGLILDMTPHIHLYNEIEPSEEQPVDLYSEFSDAFNIVRSVKPKQSQIRINNGLQIIDHLRDDSRVLGVAPLVDASVFYVAGSISLNGVISGIDPMEEDRLFNIGAYIVEGSINDLVRNNNGILLGAGIAQKLSLSIGSRIQVRSASGSVLPLKIVGIYQSGLADIDNIKGFVNIKTAQQLKGVGSNFISDINLKLFDLEDALPMSKDISSQFGLTAKDIHSANAQFDTGTSIRNIITYAVSITLLIVAGFGIYNILNMFIYEKMNDIAILKATGFSGSDVMIIFISEALIIGTIGGAMGLLMGYGVSTIIDAIPFETDALPTIKTYPVNFNGLYYIIGIIFAIVSTFLAGYLPARKAKNIDPVEIIRKH